MEASRNWVWVPDGKDVFKKGYIYEAVTDNKVKVRFDDGSEQDVDSTAIEEVNPTKFDKANDIAELTYLNEPSVLYNLEKRFADDLIYTYSGLFLVAINPYTKLPIYSDGNVNMYHNVPKADTRPHIFAETEEAYQNLLADKRDQSILVTGESGAGKTENTKKIIQYLAAITSGQKGEHTFEKQILQANPILESFGNSQTVRNNNSSRFGKFIKIEFDSHGKIAGARIDWYLLEKSRVVKQSNQERNYHIFYQLLSGLSDKELELLGLKRSPSAFAYLKDGNATIPGVDDKREFSKLKQAMDIMGIEKSKYYEVFKIMAIILHAGNIEFISMKSEQASFKSSIDTLCGLLGVSSTSFSDAILRPKVKAGKEFVKQSRTPTEAQLSLDALAKSLYEKVFKYLVDYINRSLEQGSNGVNFIGVLDIAGFEIFTQNSFEQLCINYTNEKLQQFFNHHMFVLEQNEYLKEDIDWNFIDFGQDLQDTIDLIEKRPLGIYSILEEECIVPRSSDETFFNKLDQHCKGSSEKFKPSKFSNKFTLKHYAGDVEYSIEKWIEKNRDPLSDSIVEMLSGSKDKFISDLYSEDISQRGSSFRTVSQKHKDELSDLLTLLSQTHPHFVRCIIPNHKKKPQVFEKKLVLEQLKCNGVLEGIRIVRSGFPNRIFFKEFYERYKVLTKLELSSSLKDNCKLILGSLQLDSEVYKVGSTKIFFKAGVLAELELRRDQQVKRTMTEFKAVCHGVLKRRSINQQLERIQASQVLMKAFRTYNKLNVNPWFMLYSDLKPLLTSSQQLMKTKQFSDQIRTLEKKIVEVEAEKDELSTKHFTINEELVKLGSTLQTERLSWKDRESTFEASVKHEKELQEKLEKSLSSIRELEAQRDAIENSKDELVQKLATHATELAEAKKSMRTLENEKSQLSSKVKELETSLHNAESSQNLNKESTKKVEEELRMLKALVRSRDAQIKELENKIVNSVEESDQKMTALSSSYSIANKSIKEAADEKEKLNDKIKSLQTSTAQFTSIMEKKEAELQALNKQWTEQSSQLSVIRAERDKLRLERSKLDTVRNEILGLKSRHRQLEHEAKEARELLQQKITDDIAFGRGRQQYDNDISSLKAEVQFLTVSLKEERDQQLELSRQLRETQDENDKFQRTKKESGVRLAQGAFRSKSLNLDTDSERKNTDKELLIKEYTSMRLQLNEQSAHLKKETIENNKLKADIKLLHARLASETFDKQQLRIQVKRIKSSLGVGDSPIIGDEPYDKITDDNEKLQKQLRNLQVELDLERKASQRFRSEDNTPTTRKAVLKDRNSMNSPFTLTNDFDSYKAKYEASMARIKFLEHELMVSHNKTREATPTPPDHDQDLLQIYQETSRKFNSARHELGEYRSKYESLQRDLDQSKKTIADLKLRDTESNSNNLAREELAKALLKLQATESKNMDLSRSVKLYKTRAEEYFNKLENAEASARNSKFQEKFIKEQYKESMAEIDCHKRENTKLESIAMKLNANISQLKNSLENKEAELSKLETSNSMLRDEIQTYHERLFNVSAEEKFRLESNVSKLEGDLTRALRTETELRKNIGSLEVDLDFLQSQKSQEISELTKEKAYFIRLCNDLKEENESSKESQKDLEVKLRSLMKQIGTLNESVDSLIKERNSLDSDKKRLEEQVKELSGEYLKFSNERDLSLQTQNGLKETIEKYEHDIETLKSDGKRSKAAQDNLHSLIDDEKQKNVVLVEENQSLGKFAETLKSRISELEDKLVESVKNDDAWVDKYEQLEKRLQEETHEKHEQVKNVKSLGRQVDELKTVVDRHSKTITMFDDERSKYKTKISELFNAIQKWQAADSTTKINLRRAEREVKHLQEQSDSLTNEVNNWREKFDSLTTKKRSLPTNEIFI